MAEVFDDLKGPRLNFKRFLLENGLVVLVSENPHLPLATVNGYILAGADQNPPGKAGLAELTSRLLDEGSQTRSARQISELIESYGAQVSIFSHRELTGVSYQSSSDSLETGLDILFELLVRPIFPQGSFDQEKVRLLSDIESLEDEPSALAGKIFNRHIYGGSPLQEPFWGTLKSVSSLTRPEVERFHRRCFSPQGAIFCVAGDVEAGRVKEAVARRFGDWRNPAFERRPIHLPVRQKSPLLDERPFDSEQVQIVLGHLGITRRNPDYHALQVLDLILGSGPGFTSRIPRVLRDEMGLAYLTYSNITASAGLYPGRFVSFISTSPANRRRALDQLVSEISQIIEGRFSEEELRTAQDFLTGNFVFDFESNYNVARFLLSAELFGLGLDYPRRFPQRIRSVTRDDVVRVACEYLDPLNCTTVMVGPQENGRRRTEKGR